MPLLQDNYQVSYLFRYSHFSTIYPTLFRKVLPLNYRRERFNLPDGDFIDVDLVQRKKTDLVIIQTGLEGNSKSKYVLGMASYLLQNNYDIVVVNFRGCSGEHNRLPSSYHSCSVEDLIYLIKKLSPAYKRVYLVGFSLGGNQILYYLGKFNKKVSQKVKAAACFSVPIDLAGSARELAKFKNFIYMKRFLIYFKNKIFYKVRQFPSIITLTYQDFKKVKTFHELDRLYTAPLHGFKDEYHYWAYCSSLPFLRNIQIPTLLINAENDSFLSKLCYPEKVAANSSWFYFEKTKYGGHCGYYLPGGIYYSEKRCVEFFNEVRESFKKIAGKKTGYLKIV